MKSNKDFQPMGNISKLTQYNDICTTCNNAEICLAQGNKIRPVWFCEQFDDFDDTVTNSIPLLEKQPKYINYGSAKKEMDSRQFKGLCINCELRDTCANCNTESGIWHCEEYQ
jgi:hypothetical protein